MFLRNIAVGVPFGFGIWFLDPSMTRRRAVLLGAAASAAVELLQLAIGALVGFMYRVVDVNDLIANTIGVVLGLLVFELLAGALRRVDRGLPPGSEHGLWAYVGRVAAAPVRSGSRSP